MDAQPIIDRYNKLAAKSSGYWRRLWKETRHLCHPNEESDLTEGDVRGVDTYEPVGVESRSRLASGMYAWMAPPEQKWFALRPADKDLAEDDAVKVYFADVSEQISQALANSNWPSILISALNELAAGMDAIVYCEDTGDENIINFRQFRVEDVCYCLDAHGKVDAVFVKHKMTARQLAGKFNLTELPDAIRMDAADPRRMENEYDILHAVLPRQQRDPEAKDNRNMPFADIYIELKSKKVIYESGFEEHPFAICSFERSKFESFGRGPGVNALPALKQLQRYAEADIIGTEHLADPSYLVPDGSLVDKDFNRDPGSVIIYRPDMSGAKPEQLPNSFNPALTMQKIERLEMQIKKMFFLDIFDPLGDLKNITATEAEIRNESKIVPFAPIAANLHCDLFRVIIHRVLGILLRRGMLPDLPEKLAENPTYRVEFVSKIARALQKQNVLAWMQTEATIANLAAAQPEVMDNYDLDKIARNAGLVNGVDPEFIRPEKEVEKLRADRAAAQQQQQAAEQLLAGAGALGANMGKAPEPGSPLGLVMDGGGV